MKPLAHGQEQGASTLSRPDDAAGLPAEATILTLNGALPVGDLAPGARIITRDGGMAVLRAVSRRQVMTRRVRIRAGSLGHTGTEADATLPAGQPVLLRDWRARAFCGGAQAVVPAARLVDDEFVTFDTPAAMTLCTLSFDHAHVLYVDGLELAA